MSSPQVAPLSQRDLSSEPASSSRLIEPPEPFIASDTRSHDQNESTSTRVSGSTVALESYNASSHSENQTSSTRLSVSTIAIENSSASASHIEYNSTAFQHWRLPNNWSWKGDGTAPSDVVTIQPDDESPIIEYPLPSSKTQSAVVGFSHATVSRIICQRKVLARKSEPLPRRKSTYHLEEMNILKQLNHQHIIQLCGAYILRNEYNCLLYPVAELDLAKYMHLGDSSNWVRTLTTGLGCLSNALAFIHTAGIRHRDIKPANILVLGDVMIFADFGSARKENDTRGEGFSSPGDATKSYGKDGMTWLYMAPECVDSLGHGKSADVFSLGLVMDEMLGCIFYPRRLSAVERRLEDYRSEKRESAQYEPLPMTREEEDFLQNILNSQGDISPEGAQLLFSVMTAKDPEKRPTAESVWKFFKGRRFNFSIGHPDGDGRPSTCGKCCE